MSDGPQTVPLSIPCRADLDPKLVQQYGMCVQFMAGWAKIHEATDTVDGLTFEEVMNKFAENVSRCLIGPTKGTG